MNQLTYITKEPQRRPTFLGEVPLYLYMAENPSLRTAPYICGFEFSIQNFAYPGEPMTGEMVHGACRVSYHKDEAYTLTFFPPYTGDERGDELASRDLAHFISEYQADIAFFLGDDLADALANCITTIYQAWAGIGKRCDDAPVVWLEFVDMMRYNQLFLDLCAQVAEHEGRVFDRAAKVKELVEYWCATESEFNVAGQRAWYRARPELAADSREFEVLVKKGQEAIKGYALA